MTRPLVVVDADVLGRRRTGDETYVLNLLRELPRPSAEAGIRVAAVTRHPELVPPGVEAIPLMTASQELRMAWTFPRLLRGVGAALVHTQYAMPWRCPCPAVVTIHDLSFERNPKLMRPRDRFVFRTVVPRAARRAARVIVVSERTRQDLRDLYGLAEARIVVTPNGVDPIFVPASVAPPVEGGYLLSVGAIQVRKNQLAALAAAQAVGLPLVVVGPVKDEHLAAELAERGARLEGYVTQERLLELYQGAACLIQASRYEGFGLPVLEAMASGTPVVTVPDDALLEVAGDAAVVVDESELARGVRRALADRDRLVAAGRTQAARFSWRALAEKTVATYVEALG